ncbi:M20 family metallo-hydrolase [Paratissierella segnis]|uniref:M20 family metallo-hydrolase n=1 Tax=Paratissierella segnis TaxID=2763679 RepID=A0A926EVA1_9FIRM|nr:M20 family metallo-hydrolase [Paratissierella segnis]MBC8588938.1 M20 family metallo-hydrolase [Paratissierella segnis]
MKLNTDRLKNNILKLGSIGRTMYGGITRLGFTDEYYKAADLFKELLEDAGLEVHIDKVGNVIGRKKGKKSEKIIMTGSHLDTVVNGGIFDGNMGAVAGLEFAYYIKENNIKLNHTIEIVGFNAEEGGEMGGTFGSRAMMGLIDLDKKGLVEKLGKYNLSIDDIKNSTIDTDRIKCFIEFHIEQGNILYENNIPIGIVSGIVGITRYKITALGESNHAGTTMMKGRKDAFQALAKLAVQSDDYISNVDDILVGTFGVVNIYPNMANVIPGKAEAILELRHMDQNVIDDTIERIKAIADSIDSAKFTFEKIISKKSCQCDKDIISIIDKVCKDNNIKYKTIHSGAGHDANAIAKKAPVGMIFVPSEKGKSHCPSEWTDWDDIEKGCEILFKTLLKIDEQI